MGWPAPSSVGPLVNFLVKFRVGAWPLASFRTNWRTDRNSAPNRKLCWPFCQDNMPVTDSLELLLTK